MDIERCVELALNEVPADVRARFPTDLLGVMRADFGLSVRAVDHLAGGRSEGGICDGMSYLEDGVVLYTPTDGSRRENFTLAHEFGHYLVEQAEEVLNWVADQKEPAKLLESICDQVGQQLLLPKSAIAAVVDGGPVRAQHVIDLFRASNASRPVCAIALANRLNGMGAIALVDRATGVVTDASVRPDPDRGWPTVYPWRGQQLAPGSQILNLDTESGFTRRMTWYTSWGAQADFFIDAVAGPTTTVLVFAETNIWDPKSPAPFIDRDFSKQLTLRGNCCGEDFEVRGFPCPNCHRPFCPTCGLCKCEKAAKSDIVCTNCFLLFPPHRVVDGFCEECRS